MKTTIRGLIILLFCFLFLSACSPSGERPGGNPAASSASAASPAEASSHTDNSNPSVTLKPYKEYFDNRTGDFLMDFVETETICYFWYSGRLYYWDKAAEEGGILCPRPDCQHDDPQICQAAMYMEDYHTLSFVDGKLIWIGTYDHDNNPDTPPLGEILSCNPDGSGRMAVRDLDLEMFYRFQDWRFCEGCYYGIGVTQEVRDDQPVIIREIIKIPLDGKQEIEILLHRETDFTAYQLMKVMGERVYFMLYRYNSMDLANPSIVELLGWRRTARSIWLTRKICPGRSGALRLTGWWKSRALRLARIRTIHGSSFRMGSPSRPVRWLMTERRGSENLRFWSGTMTAASFMKARCPWISGKSWGKTGFSLLWRQDSATEMPCTASMILVIMAKTGVNASSVMSIRRTA